MMTIPIKSIVSASIAIGASYPARKGFGILNCVTAETGVIGFAERIRSYSDADGVAADWPSDSEVVKLANSYFGQIPKPTEFRVSVRAANDVSAELRGGSVVDNAANVATFKDITDGEFQITIDGSQQTINSLDFSSITTLGEVAVVIETALQAVATGGYTSATCVYDGSRFFIRSGTVGASSTILFTTTPDSPVGTDITSLLQVRQGEGTKSDGIDAETITAALDAIQNRSGDWYGLIFTKEVRDQANINGELGVRAASNWCQARVKTFFNTTNDLDVLDSVTTNDIASELNQASLNRTMTTFSSYPNEYPSASIAGRAFTVNFSQTNSTLTLKFKQMPGITAEKLTTSEKNALDSKRANACFEVGDGNFIFGESYMAGDFFYDEIHGTDWLTDAIETEIYGYLQSRTTKVPYTAKGLNSIEQQMTKVLDQAVTNGLIAAGTTTDGEFLGKGYKITTIAVEDVSNSEKNARQYNGMSFTALGAGAIHGVQIQGTFER